MTARIERADHGQFLRGPARRLLYPVGAAAPLNHPRLLHANPDAAALIGLDPSAFATPEFLPFSGQQPPPGGDTLRSSVREYRRRGHAWPGHPDDARAGHPDDARAVPGGVGRSGVPRDRETAAIVTRMAPSFVRGSFEHWSARRDLDRLATLADYVIDRYYPECRETRAGEPADPNASVTNLLREVTRRTALLMADWQSVGFATA